MSNIPENLLYSNTHEWLRVEDGIGTIGITDHAQNELTEIVFVELPEVGRQLVVNDACAVVESVKSASDIHAPAAGEVMEVNAALVDAPELANDSPCDDGWFFKIKLAGEPEGLLDAAGYAAEIGES
jgi:glycine cleavage system H protein